MNTMDDIMGMIAIEAMEEYRAETKTNDSTDLPLMNYNLELIKRDDGTFYWVD